MTRAAFQSRWKVATVTLGLLACGGGSESGPGEPGRPGNEGQGWVTISIPGAGVSGSIEAPSLDLLGLAFNTPVPAYPCDFGTADTCQNLTTGAMGWVVPSQYTPTGGCANYAHRWWAEVDLAHGTNLLLIMAKDSRGNVGRAYYTVTRAQDLTPPTVSPAPGNGATGVLVGQALYAHFSDWMDPATLSTTTFQVMDSQNQAVPGTVAYREVRTLTATEVRVDHTATFTPAASLLAGATYTAALTTGVRNLDGQTLPAPVVWSFTTAP